SFLLLLLLILVVLLQISKVKMTISKMRMGQKGWKDDTKRCLNDPPYYYIYISKICIKKTNPPLAAVIAANNYLLERKNR
ncbi:MAG: hypothetical protein WA421_10095, partial [Nitrososphaeraceae archaeon]